MNPIVIAADAMAYQGFLTATDLAVQQFGQHQRVEC